MSEEYMMPKNIIFLDKNANNIKEKSREEDVIRNNSKLNI